MTVSPDTDHALREAMARLLAGTPDITDGRLTKSNLAREAGVSRATMNRAAAVLSEWDRRVADSPASIRQKQRDQELAEARRSLRHIRQHNRELQEQLDAAATVIAALSIENAALRTQFARRTAVVVPLDRAHATRE